MGVDLDKFDQNINKIIRDDNDAYWLRRWAGEAMNGIISSKAYIKEGIIIDSVSYADKMLKAFKEKEKDGKDS